MTTTVRKHLWNNPYLIRVHSVVGTEKHASYIVVLLKGYDGNIWKAILKFPHRVLLSAIQLYMIDTQEHCLYSEVDTAVAIPVEPMSPKEVMQWMLTH